MERVMKIRASLNVSELKCETSICNTYSIYVYKMAKNNFNKTTKNKWMSSQHAKVRMEKKTTSKMASC